MIRLVEISKVYNAGRTNAFVAVDTVTLTIAARTVTALQGPSGSGKTTLLSLAGCMARPTSGRIFLGERELTSLPERFLTDIRRRTFGFVFQQFNLIKGITVLENVMLPAYPTGERHGVVVLAWIAVTAVTSPVYAILVRDSRRNTALYECPDR